MNEVLHTGKDFKIIPEKFQYSTTFDIIEIGETEFKINLNPVVDMQLQYYMPNTPVEIFGSSNEGLIYFTTDIVSKNDSNLVLRMPDEHRNIQRREYSRVNFNGEIKFLNNEDLNVMPIDISAGGLKFYSSTQLVVGENYPANIRLENNLDITCDIQVIRVYKELGNDANYTVCARFKNIQSVNRIALVQYTFKTLMEKENKKNA